MAADSAGREVLVEAEITATGRGRVSVNRQPLRRTRDLLGVMQTRALVGGLRELGWYDGRNITVEHRFSGEGRERIRENAEELVALNPDVIFSVGGPPLAALLAETRTIPIVFVNVNDPVGAGFVASLAAPGGNATGIAVRTPEVTRTIRPARAGFVPGCS